MVNLDSVIVPKLQATGHDIVGFHAFGSGDGIPGDDVLSVAALRKDIRAVRSQGLQGFEAMIHAAALRGNPRSQLDAELIDQVNHRAAVHLARCAREAGDGLAHAPGRRRATSRHAIALVSDPAPLLGCRPR